MDQPHVSTALATSDLQHPSTHTHNPLRAQDELLRREVSALLCPSCSLVNTSPWASQVLKHNGSSEILNKLYDTAMDKLEVVKKDYDALRKRYSEKVAMHNSDLSRLEQLGEENQRLQKQTEMLTQQRDTAIQLQHQCALSLRR